MVALARRTLLKMADRWPMGRFLDLLERRRDERTDVLRVLTYHRVDDSGARPWLDPGLISASPADFRAQMTHLACRYQVVSMNEVLAAWHGDRPLPPRSVLVTFDDAYQDFAEQAWPILKRLELPVTLFVPTGYPDQSDGAFWWDRLYQALSKRPELVDHHQPLGSIRRAIPMTKRTIHRRLKEFVKTLPHDEAMEWVRNFCRRAGVPASPNAVLGWDVLRNLASQGVTLAAHTRSHPLMDRISRERARWEVEGSLHDLRMQIGHVLPVFAYPAGHLGTVSQGVLHDAGCQLAFTTRRGINDLSTASPLRLRRINVGRRTSLNLLRAQLMAPSRSLNWRGSG